MPITRRTQAERRATTQAAILDATIASLADVGYARTTTAEIATRADVSQGSIFRYWDTKSQVLSAAAIRMFNHAVLARRDDIIAEMDALPSGAGRVRGAIAILHDLFQQDKVVGVLSLCAGARTEVEIMQAVRPLADTLHTTVREFAAHITPSAVDSPNFDALCDVLVLALQGSSVCLSPTARPADPVDALTLMVTSLLG